MSTATALAATIAKHRRWHRLSVLAREWLAARRRRAPSLRDLDARMLADIGVHASEIDSIEAEAHGPRTGITRRRIVGAIGGD